MKTRLVRKCLRCEFQYVKPWMDITGARFSRCPNCFGFESLADVGGSIKFKIIRKESYIRTYKWYNPFGWFTGKWEVV